MKNLKAFLTLSILLLAVVYYSCDDSGVTPPNQPTGNVTFLQTNLKTLNQSDEGIYQLWAYFDSAAPSWLSLGRFNLNTNGGLVSESGGSATFTFGGDTLRMSKLAILLVTIEAPGANNQVPGSCHLIATSITAANFYLDSIAANLTFSDGNALGLPGSVMTADTGRGIFYITSPSTNNVNCSQGLWIADETGQNWFPHELDLNAPYDGWIYRMWILNNLTNTYSLCGTFSTFYAVDNDSAGPCRGAIDTFYNSPGQDFIQSGGGCTSILNMNDGNHGVYISIEPRNRTDNTKPFFIIPYLQPVMTGGCGQHQIPKKVRSDLPYGRVKISKVR